MRAAARAANGSLFAWLLTGYAAWLARTTQAEDFLIGVPTAGRHHPAAEALPGCFINTLPVRVDASGDPSFTVLFGRVRDALAAALAHQRYPFDLMVEQFGAERGAARPPLVQTLLSLQGGAPGVGDPLRLGDTLLRPLQLAGAVAWFDLSAVLWETADGALEGIFAYRSALFERDTIESFWRDWSALLEAGLTQPDEPIHNLLHDLVW
jgi:non-ribosomal peptide synthetase component F